MLNPANAIAGSEPTATVTVQIHSDRLLYRFIGRQGVSKTYPDLTSVVKAIKFVYGDAEFTCETATF